MTITQYNSNNSLIPEFKWTQSLEKSNYLVELINIPKYLWSKFRLGSTIRNPRQKLQLIHDPLCFQNPRIRAIYRTNPQSAVRFFKAKSGDPKTYSPPSLCVVYRAHSTAAVIMMCDKCEVKMAGYWPSSFFACLWTEKKSRSINSQKKERGQYPAILTEQTWSIKDLLYGFWWNFVCGIQRVVPSGQHGSILPARVANHSARFDSSCPLAEIAI